MSGVRSRARRYAVLALYQWQLTGQDPVEIARQFLDDPAWIDEVAASLVDSAQSTSPGQEKGRAYDRELFRQLLYGVPAHLDEVFGRCYTRWENRYESAREMLEALAAEGRATTAVPPAFVVPGGEALCPACQARVDRDDQFCIRCGHQLVASVPRCAACEAYVRSNDRFCIFCGNDLRVLKQ